MKVYGINMGYGDSGFVYSEQSTKIWADEVCNAKRWGFFFRPVFGEWLRPIRKFWRKDNAWTSGNHWFVLSSYIPLPGLLMSLFYKDKYFYIGTKTYGVDWSEYNVWTDKVASGNTALAPSVSIRGF